MRAAWVLLVVIAGASGCLALAGCGGGESSGTGEAPPARAGSKSGLGAERFQAVDAVYVALRAFDELKGDGAGPIDDGRLKTAVAPAVAACEALDADDALLGPFRDGCPLVVEFTAQVAGLDDCSSAEDPAACPVLFARVRRTLARLNRLGHRSDRAVRQSQLTPACRGALLTPSRAYRAFAGYDRAMRLLGSPHAEDVAAARRALVDADAIAGTLPDGKTALQRFRSGCA